MVYSALVYQEIPFGSTENVTCAVFSCNKTSHLPAEGLGLWISPLWISSTPGDNLMKIKSWSFSRYLYKKSSGLNHLWRRQGGDSLKLSTQNERNIWEPCNVSDYVCQKKNNAWKPKIIYNPCFFSTTFSNQTDVSQLILCKTTQNSKWHHFIELPKWILWFWENQTSHDLWEALLCLFSWHRLWHKIIKSFEDLHKISEVNFP